MLVVERAFWVGVWVGLRDSVRRGDGLPGGRAAGLLFLDAGCAGLVTEIRTRAEVRAGGGGSVSTQDGQDGLGVETAQGEFADGEKVVDAASVSEALGQAGDDFAGRAGVFGGVVVAEVWRGQMGRNGGQFVVSHRNYLCLGGIAGQSKRARQRYGGHIGTCGEQAGS